MTGRRRRELRDRVAELEAERSQTMRTYVVGLDLLNDATDDVACECDRDDCILCIDYL